MPIESRVWKEEIFGPVLCIRTFQSEDEAVEEANNTVRSRCLGIEFDCLTGLTFQEYGLAAAVVSADKERCQRLPKRLNAGVVWTVALLQLVSLLAFYQNCSQPAFIQAPWGGVKRSGFGNELGVEGMEEFLITKQVAVRNSNPEYLRYEIRLPLVTTLCLGTGFRSVYLKGFL